jgi:hypothetical protein
MVRTQISFDESLYIRAKHVAKRRGISLAELCRRSVAEAVASEDSERPWTSYAGIIDGESDDSTRVDEIVYGRQSP